MSTQYDTMLQDYKKSAAELLWKTICLQYGSILDYESFFQIEQELFEGVDEFLLDTHHKISCYLAEEESKETFQMAKVISAIEKLSFLGVEEKIISQQVYGYIKVSEKALQAKAMERLKVKLDLWDTLKEKLQGEKRIQFEMALRHFTFLWGNVVLAIQEELLGKTKETKIKEMIEKTMQQTQEDRRIFLLGGASEEDIDEYVSAYIAFGCPMLS